jgi:thiopurine S-methyltransferase
MDKDFWLERWRSAKIGFHLATPNPRLVEHAARLETGGPKRVLVPLCGKTLDLAYLASRGHSVVGVELAEEAALAFFAEHGATPARTALGGLERFESGAIAIVVGDFFACDPERLGTFDAVYDRAALIALPPEIRLAYVAKLRSLLAPGATILLVTFDFDASGGPPFSVGDAEVDALYPDCEIEPLGAYELTDDSPNVLARGATRVHERVYAIRTPR